MKISSASEFERFRPVIESLPRGCKTSELLRVGETGQHRLYYVPFEHANLNAKLVVVGITPGPNQLELAIQAVQSMRTLSDGALQLEIKKHASFGSPTMRPNLLKMLRHFQVAKRLGIDSESDLWGAGWTLFQATSVVPHAAFNLKSDGSEEMFNGKFSEVLGSPLLRACFENHLLPLVRSMDKGALWVGLGPTPRAALEWCAEQGLLRNEQVASFAHPSKSGGSQVDYFVRERGRDSFKPKDPVRHRLDWLDKSYSMTRDAFDRTLPLPGH